MTPRTIKAGRAYLGISQAEFAKAIGSCQTSIARIETGEQSLTTKMQGKIQAYFDSQGIQLLENGVVRK